MKFFHFIFFGQDLPASAKASARQAGLLGLFPSPLSGRKWRNPIRLRRRLFVKIELKRVLKPQIMFEGPAVSRVGISHLYFINVKEFNKAKRFRLIRNPIEEIIVSLLFGAF
jgi:hypothetical protein